MTDIAVVFDTSALLAYVAGHVSVGELIAEVSDERRAVGVPATCLAEARATAHDDMAAAHLLLLMTAPAVAMLPLGASVRGGREQAWRVGEFARSARRKLGTGHAVYEALEHGAHIATMRPDLVAPMLPAGWSVLDLR